ncbi:L,D-transpeptidase [Oricola sp.]|uniref:L,D-transpeptidase n=1 Tax=Oricola sp. TaxID=1979950 RepID=UPI003BABC6C7
MSKTILSRRSFLATGGAAATVALAGCQTTDDSGSAVAAAPITDPSDSEYALMYAQVSDGGFTIPAVPWERIDRRFLRQTVRNTTGEKPGKLIVETSRHFLYFTMPRGRAMRYGVGLGRAGFEWSGAGNVRRKAEWPKWHPPEEMIAREPDLAKYSTTYDAANNVWLGGMAGGPSNPLGARALYIYQGNVDTLYRLHGSPEWASIGRSVSSGCVRLINQDVIDLYRRVPAGTEIIVR